MESEEFPKYQAFGKFPGYPGIWEISQVIRHLGEFPSQAFEEFPKFPGIWEISIFDIFQIAVTSSGN